MFKLVTGTSQGPPGLARHSHVSGGVRGSCGTVADADLAWSLWWVVPKKRSCLGCSLSGFVQTWNSYFPGTLGPRQAVHNYGEPLLERI